ncbi:MAG: cache domain-containing protein, partial [Proteobacteria bacterium]|nr:cache domain-containing protein [Pseudomonadota bacterium]
MNPTSRHALAALWPKFWAHQERVNPYQTFTNYRRIWFLSVFLLASASLVPLTTVTLIDYELNRRAVRLEAVLRTDRLTSNLRRSLTYFFNERLSALKFTVHEESNRNLRDSDHLKVVLKNLKRGFGGFTDLGVIDATGNQVAYAGPFKLTGKNYRGQAWFVECGLRGTYISEVFMGYRDVPHMIIAVRATLPDGSFYILRATLDTDRLIQTLYSFGQEEYRDVFLINRAGVIQTPSKYHGQPFQKLDLPVPPFSLRTKAIETVDRNGRRILVGYAYISDSPYILLLIKAKAQMMQTWFNLRMNLIG